MLTISVMEPDDYDFAVELSDHEGWMHQRVDFARLTTFEPQGCFIARHDGERAGMICSTSQGDYGFLSCLIVREGQRGRKIGEQLMRHALGYLLDMTVRTIELDGVIPAVSLYRRLGFNDKYLSLRFRRWPGPTTTARNSVRQNSSTEAIADYDRCRTGLSREHIILRLGAEFGESVFVVGDEFAAGYGIVRPRTPEVAALGPLIADSGDGAKDLLREVLDRFASKMIVVGVPELNQPFVDLLLAEGFVYSQPSLRMYFGLRRNYERHVYAIVSPEKG